MADLIPAVGDLTVLVARSLPAVYAANVQKPFAVVIPDPDNWNDYGLRYFAKLWIVGNVGQPTEKTLKIMFEGYDRSETAISKFLDENGDIFPIEQIAIPFVSLIPSESDYREVIQTFGFDDGITALRKLHDAIVMRLEELNPHLVEMTHREDFHIGVLRNPAARTALRRGARHFRRDLPQAVEDSAGRFSFATKLMCAENDIGIEFDFSEKPIIRDRIAVLIGRNGVGKTQLLKSMVDGLTRGIERPDGDRIPVFNPMPAHSRVLVFSSVPTDPYPRIIHAWLGIDYEYFPVSTPRDSKNDPLLAALVTCRYEGNPPRFGRAGRDDRRDVLKSVLDRIDLWRGLYLPVRGPADGQEVLAGIVEVSGQLYLSIEQGFNERDTLVAAQRIDWDRPPVILDGAERPRALSSGEYAMLRFAAQAVAAIETGSLLLLDEPETHLHPNFVSDMIDILYSLLKATHSVAIIATHSAYVVREVSRESVKVMSVEGRVLSVDTPRLQTFGASIDTISQFVFADTNIEHHYQEILTDWVLNAAGGLNLEDIIERYGASLNAESLSHIARVLDQVARRG